MKCPICKCKMRCYSTREIAPGIRVRFYRCSGCGKTKKTIEE